MLCGEPNISQEDITWLFLQQYIMLGWMNIGQSQFTFAMLQKQEILPPHPVSPLKWSSSQKRSLTYPGRIELGPNLFKA